MIARYIDKALRRARYAEVDPGVYCATVPGLRESSPPQASSRWGAAKPGRVEQQ